MPISRKTKIKANGLVLSRNTSTHYGTVLGVSRKPTKSSTRQNKKVAKEICGKKKVSINQHRHPLKLLYSSNAESYMSTDTECGKDQKAGSLSPLKETLVQTKNESSFMWRREKKTNKRDKSVDLKIKQQSSADVTRNNNDDVLSHYEHKWSNYITERRKEVISQYDAKQSREIISHILARSISSQFITLNKTSYSDNSFKRSRGKHCNVFKLLLLSMSRKIKHKNSGHNPKKPNDVIVLHVPKKFSNISLEATTTRRFITPAPLAAASAAPAFTTPASKHKKKKSKEQPAKFQPLKIRDSFSDKMIYINRLTKPPNKLCGRGEIFMHDYE